MAKEEVSAEQKKKEEETCEVCKAGLEDKKFIDSENLEKQIKAQTEEIVKKLADLPKDLTAQLNDLKITLNKVVCGVDDPNDPNFEPLSLINQLKGLIEPIIGTLKSLPVPDIPGLSMLVDILGKLTDMATKFNKEDFEDQEFEWDSLKPEIPKELKEIIVDLCDTIQVIMSTLPIAIFNIVFAMFDAVIGCFMSIIGVIGVPSIPWPLSLAPQMISLIPDLMKLVGNTGIEIKNICEGIIKEKVEVMNKCQFPPMPNHLPRPEPKPPCPLRGDEDKPKENKPKEGK